MNNGIALAIGLVGGILGGIFGLGGGVVVVPALILLLGVSEHTAVGTSLGALLPPVGILGAVQYYRQGEVNVPWAILIGLGLLVGAWFGASLAGLMSGLLLRRLFSLFLILIALRLMF